MKKGEHITEETRIKMKLAHKSHTVTDETKQKIAESNKKNKNHKKWDNPRDYWQQECFYNGWYCSLRQLSNYFRKSGVEKYTAEAKKYLTGEMVQTPIRKYGKRNENGDSWVEEIRDKQGE